jgi:hypothetical protein
VKFFLENESDNKAFQFSIKFNINRNKVVHIGRNEAQQFDQ